MQTAQARVDGGASFMRQAAATGRWAAERLIEATKAGRPLRMSELRTCDTLRKDEWKAFDEALLAEGVIRIPTVAMLLSRGLSIPINNALGKTLFEYEKITDMEAAVVSLDGLPRGDSDRQEFSLSNIPVPIIHKDFDISIRTLAASRERGESLDTTQAGTAGRLCAEELENILINGGPQFGGSTIPGFTTESNRNTAAHGTNGVWSDYPTKSGANMVADVITMKSSLQGDRFYGPYGLILPPNYDTVIDNDFKTESDDTIRERLLRIDGLDEIVVADKMTNSEMVMFQMTRDVAAILDGEQLPTVQWDLSGGMAVAFKAMMIQVPLIRSTQASRSGVFHMSGT